MLSLKQVIHTYIDFLYLLFICFYLLCDILNYLRDLIAFRACYISLRVCVCQECTDAALFILMRDQISLYVQQ